MVNCCYREEKCPTPDAIYRTMDMCLQIWECTKKECPHHKSYEPNADFDSDSEINLY